MSDSDRVDVLEQLRELLREASFKNRQEEMDGEFDLFERFMKMQKDMGASDAELAEMRGDLLAVYREHLKHARRRQQPVLKRVIPARRRPVELPPPQPPRQLPPGS